jgi:hypothetical protein
MNMRALLMSKFALATCPQQFACVRTSSPRMVSFWAYLISADQVAHGISDSNFNCTVVQLFVGYCQGEGPREIDV